jgi:hypothetical protein
MLVVFPAHWIKKYLTTSIPREATEVHRYWSSYPIPLIASSGWKYKRAMTLVSILCSGDVCPTLRN